MLQLEKLGHFNLDAIISVGYRVNSTRATRFRQWAIVQAVPVARRLCRNMEESVSFGQHMPSMAMPEGDTVLKTRDEIFPLDKVAASLKAGKQTVYRLAQQGEIPAFKLGGTRRFRHCELDHWIAEHIHKQKPEAV